MLDWDDLRFLLAIRDGGSASSAARRLGVDKATVARRVTDLERELGVRLLVRQSSGWRATAAGERVALVAREIDRRLVALRADFAGVDGAPRTAVSVTAPHWFCTELLLPALPAFIEEAPWVDWSVAATSRVLSLPQREADVALRNTRPEHGDFVVRRAGELGSTVYASRSYAKRHRIPLTRDEWARHRLVGYVERITYVPALRWLDELVGLVPGVVRADDANALREAIKAGAGVGVIPCLLGDRDPALSRFADAVHRETIWLASPAEVAGTRGVKLVSAFIAGLFREHAAVLRG